MKKRSKDWLGWNSRIFIRNFLLHRQCGLGQNVAKAHFFIRSYFRRFSAFSMLSNPISDKNKFLITRSRAWEGIDYWLKIWYHICTKTACVGGYRQCFICWLQYPVRCSADWCAGREYDYLMRTACRKRLSRALARCKRLLGGCWFCSKKFFWKFWKFQSQNSILITLYR